MARGILAGEIQFEKVTHLKRLTTPSRAKLDITVVFDIGKTHCVFSFFLSVLTLVCSRSERMPFFSSNADMPEDMLSSQSARHPRTADVSVLPIRAVATGVEMQRIPLGRQAWSLQLQEEKANMAIGSRAADEEARAEVEVLNSRLEKTAQLTKKIQASLNRLEASGKSLGDAIKPIAGSTQRLQVFGNSERLGGCLHCGATILMPSSQTLTTF